MLVVRYQEEGGGGVYVDFTPELTVLLLTLSIFPWVVDPVHGNQSSTYVGDEPGEKVHATNLRRREVGT